MFIGFALVCFVVPHSLDECVPPHLACCRLLPRYHFGAVNLIMSVPVSSAQPDFLKNSLISFSAAIWRGHPIFFLPSRLSANFLCCFYHCVLRRTKFRSLFYGVAETRYAPSVNLTGWFPGRKWVYEDNVPGGLALSALHFPPCTG